jgi:putative transposase
MPRHRRQAEAGFLYHVCNRGSRKGNIFERSHDYDVFTDLMEEARTKVGMRIVAHCLMRTHWHFLLWPQDDDSIPRFVQRLTSAHARYWHSVHGSVGTGAVYQSRYRSVRVVDARQYFATLLYIERNALAAAYVDLADAWPWCSAWQGDSWRAPFETDPGPYPRPRDWLNVLNADFASTAGAPEIGV